ncbi:MAG TPA: ABC transporter permease [Chitinophagales bacterium]|nr:ABC transporter permease [Chitinophagales bacterium]
MSREAENELWSEEISTKRGLLDFKLNELWRYRDLITMFVKRDFASTYKQTVLGPLWFFISPFMTVLMYTFVFSTIAGIQTDSIPAPLFYLTGTTLWNYFNQCFLSSSGTFINNASIFGKVYFPRLVSPISSIISNLIKFFIQLAVLVVIIVYYVLFRDFEVHVSIYILLFPVLVLLMAGISFGVGVITSALTTKYRDLQLFINYGVAMLMYATPVIYPISQVPERFKPYLMLNPLSPIIETFRYSVFGVGVFSWGGLGYSAVFMTVVVFIGIVIFNQVEKTFMDTV